MIHLVYPYGPRRVAPWTIGNNLGAACRAAGHEVRHYDWTDTTEARPTGPNDILVGHPHPHRGHTFCSSLRNDWAKAIAMTPWGGLQLTEALVDDCMPYIDSVALICGPSWAARVPGRWSGKAVTVDMAIDFSDYPRCKGAFNPPGQRRLLYVGCTAPSKGTGLLAELAGMGHDITHIGPGTIPGTRHMGYIDTTSQEARDIAAECDFLIAPGTNDANPTTVLEGASWGLIALVTEGAGWGEDVAYVIPHVIASAAIRMVEQAPCSELNEHRFVVEKVIRRYSWERFTSRILALF